MKKKNIIEDYNLNKFKLKDAKLKIQENKEKLNNEYEKFINQKDEGLKKISEGKEKIKSSEKDVENIDITLFIIQEMTIWLLEALMRELIA